MYSSSFVLTTTYNMAITTYIYGIRVARTTYSRNLVSKNFNTDRQFGSWEGSIHNYHGYSIEVTKA
jgi:uncharacterized protein YjlB